MNKLIIQFNYMYLPLINQNDRTNMARACLENVKYNILISTTNL